MHRYRSFSPQIAIRHLANPPRKSFVSSKNALAYWWYEKVPVNFKYGAGLVCSALSLANIHVNTLVTLGPPLGVMGYFTYRKLVERQYGRECSVIVPRSIEELHENTVEIKRYDESDVKNVLDGIDNEFDHFKAQVLDVVNKKIRESVKADDTMFVVDNQINFKLGDIENFVVSKVKVQLEDVNEKLDFIKFAMPVNHGTKRKGVVEVYMLKLPEEDEKSDKIVYRLKTVISPYKGL